MMFVTYKITCVITGKFYIGSHKTNDINDDYMGSGRLIKKSIEEYGVESHTKEILGVFDTREESIELEHALIKQHKNEAKEKLLNLSFGGSSFDFINDNLKFDRAKFGSLASHQHAIDMRSQNIKQYNEHPRHCLFCDKPISYDKRINRFCSRSCAASYHNAERVLLRKNDTVTIVCQWCGKTVEVLPEQKRRKFCGQDCINAYKNAHREMTEKRKLILKNLSTIIERHKNESYRKIAKDYGVSGNFIKDMLKENAQLQNHARRR